jgi:hypothetical protein
MVRQPSGCSVLFATEILKGIAQSTVNEHLQNLLTPNGASVIKVAGKPVQLIVEVLANQFPASPVRVGPTIDLYVLNQQ